MTPFQFILVSNIVSFTGLLIYMIYIKKELED